MNSVLDTKKPQELGQELQSARKQAGYTQEAAAELIGVARTTIVAIEKGDRRIKPGELMKLAKAYQRQVSDFVRARPKITPFDVQFRGPAVSTTADSDAIAPVIEKFQELTRNYIELENKLNKPLPKRYPREYSVGQMKVDQAGEWIASEERNRLGLGSGPIPILRTILEQDVGLRIFFIPMPGKFSAMYIYTEECGGCIAVNAHHPEERRRLSLAHDYFHFLSHRHQADVYAQDSYQKVPKSEQVADAFAFSFTMPKQSVIRKFQETKEAQGKVTPADLCIIANYYGVSVEAMTRRLEDLHLLPTGTWDKIMGGNVKIRELQEQLGIGSIPAYDQILPVRYQVLAISAYDEGLISEGELARFLLVDQHQARIMADAVRANTNDLTSNGLALS